jgi:hypothetical protein
MQLRNVRARLQDYTVSQTTRPLRTETTLASTLDISLQKCSNVSSADCCDVSSLLC